MGNLYNQFEHKENIRQNRLSASEKELYKKERKK